MAYKQISGTEIYWADKDNDGKYDTYLTHEEDESGKQQIVERSGGAHHIHRSGTDTEYFERIINYNVV